MKSPWKTTDGADRARSVPAIVAAIISACAVAVPAAHAAEDARVAEEELDAVTVTGRRDLESVRDVPQSISVISGTELERENAYTLDSITKRLSNIKWNFGNSQSNNYSIRGVGKISHYHAADPSVGINVDGLAYAYNQLGSFHFFDVDSVQAARGPQGTQFGKNSTVGTLSIRTKAPSFMPGVEFSLGFNQYQPQKYSNANGNFTATTAATGPLVDGLLAYRATVHIDRGAGYLVNKYNPSFSTINKDRAAGRFQLLFTPDVDLSARLIVEVNPRNNENSNGGTIATPTPTVYADGSTNSLGSDASTRLARRWFLQNRDYSYDTDYLSQSYLNNDSQGPVVTGTNGALLEVSWNVADRYEVTSISGFKDYYFDAFNDEERTVFDIVTASGQRLKYKQLSQELRVKSAIGNFVDYQAGLYLLNAKNPAEVSNIILGSDAGAWYANNAQYNLLDADAAGRYLLLNSVADLWKSAGYHKIHNKQAAIFAEADWHLSEAFSLTTGFRLSKENRRNTVVSPVIQNGLAPELNPAVVNGVDLGGFASATNGNLVAGENSAAQLALADSVALKYFGVASYDALTAQQRAQVGAAKTIRRSQIGVVWDPVAGEPYKEVQPTWVISPRFRVNENLTTYASFRHGEKGGVPQVVNGLSLQVKPERNDAYEIGAKSTLLNSNLVLNVAAFVNNITNYQQQTREYDEYTTNLNRLTDPSAEPSYTSVAGNVPKLRAKGIELDAVFTGIPGTQVRLAGAYNDARYKDYPNSPQPSENGNLSDPYQDVSGRTLPGAAKWTFDLGAEYRLPVLGAHEFHASINAAYSSRFNSDNSLSSYSWIPSTIIADASLGLGRRDGTWDAVLYVKNLLNDDTPLNQSWNSFQPAFPRLFGVMFRGRLY